MQYQLQERLTYDNPNGTLLLHGVDPMAELL